VKKPKNQKKAKKAKKKSKKQGHTIFQAHFAHLFRVFRFSSSIYSFSLAYFVEFEPLFAQFVKLGRNFAPASIFLHKNIICQAKLRTLPSRVRVRLENNSTSWPWRVTWRRIRISFYKKSSSGKHKITGKSSF